MSLMRKNMWVTPCGYFKLFLGNGIHFQNVSGVRAGMFPWGLRRPDTLGGDQLRELYPRLLPTQGRETPEEHLCGLHLQTGAEEFL